jgi:glutathione S-transferase
MKLYNTVISGNCYKIRLLLSFLNLDYEKVSINLADQEQKTADFLKLNPLGQIPVLEDQGDISMILKQSCAISLEHMMLISFGFLKKQLQ